MNARFLQFDLTRSCIVVFSTCVALALVVATPALAYLGGFEPADGYTITPIPESSGPASQYIDVTYYNAGQNGANAGGGAAAPLAPDTGLWDLITQPGAFFRTAAKRASSWVP